MILSRNVVFSDNAQDFLRRAQISENDDRIQAILWYLKHDTRLSALRPVSQTRSGEQLFAYRTAATRFHPSLVAYLTVSGSFQHVVVQAFLLPVPRDDSE